MFLSKIREKREAELKRQKQSTMKKAGLAFLIGSTISAVVTLFTAPKSGKEMRQDVKVKVEEGTEVVKDSAAKLANKTSEVVDDVLSKGQTIKDKVVLKINATKKNAKDTAEDVADSAEAIMDTVKEEVSELTDNDHEKK